MSGSILLFIPSYNCERQIVRVLRQLDDTVRSHFDEVIVVNNRSTDGTEFAALSEIKRIGDPRIKLLRNRENYGLGGSHKVAFDYAIAQSYEYVAVLHGDDQGNVRDLVSYIERGTHLDVDCLLGARFHPASSLVGYSIVRKLGNRVFNALFSLVARRRLYDLGAGLNLYRTEILKDQFYKGFSDDLTFNYCMILAHCHYRHRIVFVPIEWREDDQISNVRLFRQAVRSLGLLARFAVSPQRFTHTDHRLVQHDAYAWDEIASVGAEATA
jgi:glycosyltransferase involved in cell wall biosynthesis